MSHPKSPIIIICVFGCATNPKYKQQILKIKETWYKHALAKQIDVIFFLGEEDTDLHGPEYIYLKGVGNDYESASMKQNFGIQYIHDQMIREDKHYDYIHVCGTDTFINIDVLQTVVGRYDSTENLAIGGHGDYRQIDDGPSTYFLDGGPGFSLSKPAVQLIYPYLENMFDVWRQKCIEQHLPSNFIPACDLSISYYLQTITKTKIISEDQHFFQCNYRGVGQVDFHKIAACHNMSLDDFDEYNKLVEK